MNWALSPESAVAERLNVGDANITKTRKLVRICQNSECVRPITISQDQWLK